MARMPVECIAEMKPDSIRPMRIRYEDNEGKHVVNIDNIIHKDKKKVFATMNNPASIEYVFKCETKISNMKKTFTLIYNNQSCRWYMYI
jgi:hypothetical protein